MARERTENPYKYISYALPFARIGKGQRGGDTDDSSLSKHDCKEGMQRTRGCNMADWVRFYIGTASMGVGVGDRLGSVGEEEGC